MLQLLQLTAYIITMPNIIIQAYVELKNYYQIDSFYSMQITVAI